jgi:hypothetical protein
MDRARSRDMIIFWTSCFARYPGSALTTERGRRWPAEAPLPRQERPFRRPYQTALITTQPAWSRLFTSQQNHSSPRRKTCQRENAFSVPVPSPGQSGAAARAHQGSRLRQATGTGQSHPPSGARRPLRALALSGGQRRAEPRSFPAPRPALRAAGPLARRALRLAGGGQPAAPVPPGTVQSASSVVRGPFPRCVGRGPAIGAGPAAGPVRAAQSGTGLPAAGPRGAARARRSWSGRSPRGGLRGGPAVGPSGGRPASCPPAPTAARAAAALSVRASCARRTATAWVLPCHPGSCPPWTDEQTGREAELSPRIAEAGTRPHPVYAAGMPRLSRRFCVLASRSALVIAARLDPDGAEHRATMEERMGHRFRNDLAKRRNVTLGGVSAPVRLERLLAKRRVRGLYDGYLVRRDAASLHVIAEHAGRDGPFQVTGLALVDAGSSGQADMRAWTPSGGRMRDSDMSLPQLGGRGQGISGWK